MRQLNENNIGLPDFVEMTNYCEAKGYEVRLMRSLYGIRCYVYLHSKLLKSGAIIYDNCIDAQKESYAKIYKAITKC